MAALVKYKYLGLSTVVQVDYPEPDVKLDLWGGTVGQYGGLDRFGRVVDHRWIDYGQTPNVDVSRIQYGYDGNSNRLWRQNDVARAASKKFDQAYAYDGLNRLTDFQRGLLDGNHAIPSNDLTFRQKWGLDAVGNWSCFDQDDDGDGTFDLKQQRSTNKVNEITDMTETAGSSWATPTYNAAGNSTAFPKPSDLTSNYTAEYDAWNRLVRIKDGANNVQDNEYDGRNFRVIKKSYSGGSLDETRHIYFTNDWQAIEERVDSSTDPERQFVWGQRYIDDLVLRGRDTTGNGTLDERLYALQDANWNVTTITDQNGDVQERYEYEAYGKPIYLDASWAGRSSSNFGWDTLFAGYCFDNNVRTYVVRLRTLIAELGRWLQRDPRNYADSRNLYAYVNSRVLTFTDSTGTLSYRSVGGGPQTLVYDDNRHFFVWWGVGVYGDADDMLALKLNEGGALITERDETWTIESCNRKFNTLSGASRSWHLDQLRFDNKQTLIQSQLVLRGEGGPMQMADQTIALGYIEALGWGSGSALKNDVRAKLATERRQRRMTRADIAAFTQQFVDCTKGQLTLRLSSRLFAGGADGVPHNFQGQNAELPQATLSMADFLHKPWTTAYPAAWLQDPTSRTSAVLRFSWDLCNPKDLKVKIETTGDAITSGPQRPGRGPQSGATMWIPQADGEWKPTTVE